ncbi:MAG: radical SAM protein [Nitrososphaera sp.]
MKDKDSLKLIIRIDQEEIVSRSKISRSIKGRKAALKAWETIRRNQRAERSNFLSVMKLDELHPERNEEAGLIQINKNPSLKKMRTTYGKQIVGWFDKTPADIGCGRFCELRWGFGCPLDCNYCYLRGTGRGNMKPRYIRIDHVLMALDDVFRDPTFNDGKPTIFNTGELADSWMNPEHMIQIVDKFEEQDKHKVALLTKFGSDSRMAEFLLKRLRKQTITAFSINAPEVARLYEKAAAPPQKRIEAASLLSKAGYDTRVRIDPIFPIENWKPHYEKLIHMILDAFEPRKIILGTPRGLWKTIVFAKKAGVDMSWTQWFAEDSGWGKKLDHELRKEVYGFFFDKFDEIGYDTRTVTICKETSKMWEAMNLPFKPRTCNCYGGT